MTMTYRDLLERLKLIDEVSLMELLEVYSGALVDRFEDKIEENLDYLIMELEEEDVEDTEGEE